jgi:hypothetical protein
MYKHAGYQASKRTVSQVTTGSTSRNLFVNGVVVDTVQRVSSKRSGLSVEVEHGSDDALKYHRSVGEWLNEVEEMATNLTCQSSQWSRWCLDFFNVQTLDDALCRTLIANHSLFQRPSSIRDDCNSWSRYKKGLQQNFSTAMNEDEWKGVYQFNSDCTSATLGRRFFTTKNGFIGLTSPGTRPRDLVVILLGGKTPFIIRDDSKGEEGQTIFKLVGEAYIDGLMNGEGLVLDQVRKIELS